jgi:hypothetical protein
MIAMVGEMLGTLEHVRTDFTMAKWHIVIKKINGRRYRYRQMSWRENGRTVTRSEYLEPADGPWRTAVKRSRVRAALGPTDCSPAAPDLGKSQDAREDG